MFRLPTSDRRKCVGRGPHELRGIIGKGPDGARLLVLADEPNGTLFTPIRTF